MEITLRHSDNFRIETHQGENFIDVSGMDWEQGIRVTGHPFAQYIEVRVKERQLATFYFKNKRAKKELNLGWWQDAEVVYAINEVNK